MCIMPPIKLNASTASYILIAALIGLVAPWCLMRAVDEGLTLKAFKPTLLWGGAAALAQLVSGWLGYWARARANDACVKLEQNVRQTLFARATGAPLIELTDEGQERWPGQILTAASSCNAFLNAIYTSALPLCVLGLGTLLVLLTLSWQLAIVSFVLFPVCGGIMLALRRPIRHASKEDLAAQEALYSELLQDFTSLIPLRAFGRYPWMQARFRRCCEACASTASRLYARNALQAPIFDSIQALVLVTIFGVGGWYVSEGVATLGVVVGFQFYLSKLFSMLRSGATLYASYHRYREGRVRAKEICALNSDVQPQFEACEQGIALRIHGLTFGFGDHVVWRDYDLRLKNGERYAILSHSGAGKTTLARLILGLYTPQAGAIALPDASSSSVGYVPQENFLISGTLRDNVEFLSGALSDDQFAETLEICGLSALNARLGCVRLGARGLKLSGGEQRRVMLARALATAPKLLIIDQMTSELEPELCDAIFTAIQNKRPSMAILYLGHRSPWA